MPTATSSVKIDLSSENKTEELAVKISKKLKRGDIVFFYGEMGVGKTTFIKHLIQEFQRVNKLKQIEVTSPTFNLLNEYQIGKTKINHYDLFRLKSNEEIKNLDLFSDKQNTITLIEWPQMIKEKPENLIEFVFEYEENYEKRFVHIKGLNL
jgi:tRNA threonylcarbamoyl adenosine modification protein YjeE|tara:strand:+ start:146 stop:601 length:456 start_codon:yes stop_codon:yes gene_type:complete